MLTRPRYICAAFTLLLYAAIFLFLWLGRPQYLTYQEQYQLFLFTGSYFTGSMALPGGLADYISEFVVQFCYIPLYGAAMIALLLTAIQVLLGAAATKGSHNPLAAWCISAIPPVLLLGALADENTLMSYAAAMLLTSAATYATSFIKNPTAACLTAIAAFIPLYWCSGPVAVLYPVCVALLRRRWLHAAAAAIVSAAIIFIIWEIWSPQYPLGELYLGINYYRVPFVHPAIYYVIAASFLIIAALPPLLCKLPRAASLAAAAAVAVCGIIYVPLQFDQTKDDILLYDMLVRQGRWTDIIAKAEKHRPSHNFCIQALNLALAKTGQLTQRMFEFDQTGVESLLSPAHLDNTSMLITAEVLYQLPLTNAALSTTFDLQESIMNNRKSGRFMKRIAECMLINGRHEAARKYINMLRHSLFYREWAEMAYRLSGDDKAIDAHPVYGPKRRMAFTRKAFYFMPEIEKIFTMLAYDCKGANPLAWEYANAALMLKCDLPTLAAVSADAARQGQPLSARHLQEALAMFWTMTHPNFDGVTFDISQEIQQSIASLAAAVMRSPGNPAAWQGMARGTYWAYFIDQQQKQQNRQTQSDSPATATHE